METPETRDVTPAPIQEPDELASAWQEYLQKCCEVGQITYQLDQINGQTRQMEKNLEVTQAAVKKAAAKHRELQSKSLEKLKPVENKEAVSH